MELLINNDIVLLTPFIIFSLAAFGLLFADLAKNSPLLENMLFGLSLAFCLLGISIFVPDLKDSFLVFFNHGLFVADPMGNFFNLLVIMVLAFTLMVSKDFLKKVSHRHGEYYSLLFFSSLGMLVLIGSNNLLCVFLGLEIMSIPLYILSGFLKDDLRSKEAAMKYFILGAFSTGLFAMGVALVYGATGTLELGKIFMYVSSDKTMLAAGFALLLIGLGFKIALVPFHMWAPDVYEGAPTPVVAFMSVTVKIATFAAFIRIFVFSPVEFAAEFIIVMKILAIASMTLGNLAALYQKNIKRMLAYSSIAHAGYILIAVLSARGAAGKLGISALLFYFVAYAMMKLGAFSVVSFFEGKDCNKNNVEDYAELAYKYPFAGLAMAVFMFSLAGIPLTAGFMGKLYVFSAAIKAGYLDLAIIGAINSLVSVYYYLRVVVFMYMKKSETSHAPGLAFPSALVIGVAMVLILVFGIFPGILLSLTDFVSGIIV